jgi:predicted nucleotidyltransferase
VGFTAPGVKKWIHMLKEPDFGPEEGAVYAEALDALGQAGIRFMLGGALALNVYTGIWRDTKDLDVFVPAKEVGRCLASLGKASFDTRIEDPHWLAKASKGRLFLDIIHANDNGLGVVEENWLQNAKETEVLGRRVAVIPAEEMLLSKMFVAASDRYDLSDVLHLVFATRGELDWERLLDKVGEHWELLLAYLHLYRYVYPSHAHYVPDEVLESLFERVEREPSPGGFRFRGTMLDEVSFAVDVREWGLPDERVATRRARRPGEGSREQS